MCWSAPQRNAGRVAIALDDAKGKFLARKRADGRYEINVTQHAATGKFALVFPPFENHGIIQRPPGLPPIIVFDGSAEFLAYKSAK